MIPSHPLLNQNSHFIISLTIARVIRMNNKVIVRGKRRYFVIELKLKRKEKRKTSLYIYKFLSKKFSNYSFNFSFMKKFTWIFELLIQFLLCEKNLLEFWNYSSNFSFAKKNYLNFQITHLIFPLQKKFTWIFKLLI